MDPLDYLNTKSKFKKRIADELGTSASKRRQITTRDYEFFKRSFMPKPLSLYEKLCNFSEKILPIKPDKNSIPEIERAIKISHLNVTPGGTFSFAFLGVIAIFFFFTVFGYFLPVLLTDGQFTSMFFIVFGLIMGAIMLIPMTKIPFIISNHWRMKASNQMVLSIFYVVTYMRHTPNLELAIDFAGEHLEPPLSLDFKKVIWDIETGRFDNITQSLDSYLETWRKWNPEFIESMHLIESSLYETSEDRRMNALDKSLDVILDETYEKMLHYTHDLKGPISTLHMLGIILPILGLVILPLVVAFVPEAQWYHLFAVYNITLPVLVYYLGRDILSTRPTGYGGIDSSNLDAVVENESVTIKFKGSKDGLKISPFIGGVFIFAILLILGFTPLAMHALNPGFDLALTSSGIVQVQDLDAGERPFAKFLDYREVFDEESGRINIEGPHGLGASLFSLLIPLAFGLGLGFYYKTKTSGLVKIRERTSELEKEFASALFQLGNRLGDGIPAEIAFSDVAKVMKGTRSGQFFDMVSANIIKLGMGVESAIFDKDVGALKNFPSSIIESSMKVFSESSKKGPLIASQALITVAEYVKQMHRVDERLKDLLSDIISNMKSQISFLTPTITAIVVGITAMIAQILGSLGDSIGDLADGTGSPQGMNILGLFEGGGIPTFYFQAIVGLYVVQITLIMSILINGIQNGTDKIGEQDLLGHNLIRSTLIYVTLTFVFMLVFSILASSIIQSVVTV